MSNEDQHKKNPQSFEDAMNRIVKAKVSNAIQIREKDKPYEIIGAMNSYVEFLQLSTLGYAIDLFYLEICVTGLGCFDVQLARQEKNRPDNYIFPQSDWNPVAVPGTCRLTVAIKSRNLNQKFEVASLNFHVQKEVKKK